MIHHGTICDKMLTLSNSLSVSGESVNNLNEYKQIKEIDKKTLTTVEDNKSDSARGYGKVKAFFETVVNNISVEPVTFCYACALILHAPLIQQYVYQRLSEEHGLPGNINNDISTCDIPTQPPSDQSLSEIRDNVQSLTSYFHMCIILSAAVPSLFMALFLGSWSDKVGRRVVIMLPVIGGLLDSACIIATILLQAPLYFLCIGSFANGVCGFFTTMILAVFAYIADVTDSKDRSLRLGILEAVAFTSGMISHMTSGWWIHHLGFKAPYIFIFSLHLFSLLYVLFILPESVKNPQKLTIKNLFNKEHIEKMYDVFKQASPEKKWPLYGLVVTSAFMMISSIGFGSVIVLYTLDTPFCLSPIMIGYFLADCMLMQALGAIFALLVLQKCISEILLTQLGILSMVSSLVMIALIKRKGDMFLVPLVGCFGGVCMPIIRSKMSKLVDANQQGALFAAVAMLETLCTLFGAAIFNSLYPMSVQRLSFKGFCFLVMAGLLIVPSCVIWWLGYVEKRSKNEGENEEKMTLIVGS